MHHKPDCCLALAIGIGVCVGAVAAQGVDTDSHALEALPADSGSDLATADRLSEIIVTAQKRDERLSDVPLSITALTGKQLFDQGIISTADLEQVVPGFTYRLSQYAIPIYSIRGIGFYDTQLAAGPAVTIYVDQVPLPYARMAEGAVLDVERVEVLKGPQGTLWGQNSTGGAVNYIAAKPTDSFTAGADATYGRFSEVDAGGFVSGPVTTGLNARLSFRTEQRNGWQESITRDASNGTRDFSAGRLLLDWTPADRLQVQANLNGWVDKSETQASQPRGYLPVNPAPPTTPVTIATATALTNYPYPTANNNRLADWDANRDLHRNDSFYQVALHANYSIKDGIKLVSITSYSHLEAYSPLDLDATDVPAIFLIVSGHIDSFSQELRLEGTAGRLKWVVGGNFERDETREIQGVTIKGSNSQVGTYHFNGLNNINDDDIDQTAGFGDVDYRMTDTLTIQGGVRYTRENRDFAGCLADDGSANGFRLVLSPSTPPGGCLTFLPNGKSGLYESSLDQNNTSWRGSVNWKPDPDVLLYASVTKGYKAGTFSTIPAVSYLQLIPVPQESVLAYETGFKAHTLNRRFDVSGAAFYYDYRDKQLQGYRLVPPFGNLPNLVSIPKSRVQGAELDARMLIMEGLNVSLGATYVDSLVLGTAMVGSPFGAAINAAGEAFPATPKWQLQADAEYDFPISGTWNAFIGAGFSYLTATVAAFGSMTGPAGTQNYFNIDAYGLLNARAGIDSKKYRVEFFGRNITNRQYWIDVTHDYDTYDRTTGFPATFGITVSARY